MTETQEILPLTEPVHLVGGRTPDDHDCRCRWCRNVLGELRRADGTFYSRLERRQYYDFGAEKEHVAKTPLHVARWAIQEFSPVGGWVLDPTIGAGTTAVEAVRQGRNVAGVEIQYIHVIKANLAKQPDMGARYEIHHNDARNVGKIFEGRQFDLVVNNPPYSGDERETGMGASAPAAVYDKRFDNIAFLREGEKYWRTIEDVYRQCVDLLVPGGHFVVGVKDMVRNQKRFPLHTMLGDALDRLGLDHVGTAFLKHYPGTLFLNTYERKTGVKPPSHQIIVVFRKPLEG